MSANLENSASCLGLEKVRFSFRSQRKGVPKNVQTTGQLCSFHMPAGLCSKSFKLGFSNRWTKNFQVSMLDLENKRSYCQYTLDHRKSKRVPEKHLYCWLCQSLWLCGSQQTVENSEIDRNTRTHDPPPKKSVCRSRSNRLVPNWGRSMSRLYIVTLLI